MRGSVPVVLALLAAACGSTPAPEASPTASAEALLLVSQKADKSIAWYTLAGEKLASAGVSDHPHEIVRSPDGRWLYVTDNGVLRIEDAGAGGNKVSIVDLEARKKAGEIDLGPWRRPHGIDLCADGRLLVTSEAPDRLLVIDPQARRILHDYPTGGQTPHIVRCSRDSAYAYVSNARSRTVAKIDLAGGEAKLVETGDRPEGSVLSRDGSKLYVAHRDAHKVVILNTASWTILGEFPTSQSPVRCGLSGDERTLVYGLFGAEAIGFADLETMREVATVPIEGPAVSLEVMPDGETATACAQEQDVCYVVSIPRREILHTVRVAPGAGPDPALLLGELR